jgi:hypothetical protein
VLELLREFHQQFVGVGVLGLVMTELLESVLKRPHALQIGALAAIGGNRRGLEIGVDARPPGLLKLSDGGLELFLRIAADFAPEEHHKNIALPYGTVVLVLQPRRHQRVKKILPDDHFEKDASFCPDVVLLTNEQAEPFAVVGQFGRRGKEDFRDRSHRSLLAVVRRRRQSGRGNEKGTRRKRERDEMAIR